LQWTSRCHTNFSIINVYRLTIMTPVTPTDTGSSTVYDEVPYPSYCYQASSPAKLATVGTLFGVDAAPVENARILELGCAAGGNIIPLAYLWPEATLAGIDLSTRQIHDGQQVIRDLGLGNITLTATSIEDFLKEDHSPFDYIIAHGVYSWVDADVQDAIFAVCSRFLAKNGLAYISYNTLPGWNTIQTIRDMMLYHNRPFTEPGDKVREARSMLRFVAENVRGETSPYKQILEAEIATLSKADDPYLLHDHLATTNTPCYFHEFMEKAEAHALAYVGDADLESMYVGSLKEEAAMKLGEITDIIRQEQYMDFLNNRRFRSTILCRQAVTLGRALQPQALQAMNLYTGFAPGPEQKHRFTTAPAEVRMQHRKNASQQVSIKGKGACAIMLTLAAEKGHPVSCATLMERVHLRFPEITPEQLEAGLSVALHLVFTGVLHLLREAPVYARVLPEKPRVFPVAAYTARTSAVVPTLRHEALRLLGDQRKIIQYADGSRTIDAITACIRQEVANGTLALRENGKRINDSPDLQIKIRDYVRHTLATLLENELICEENSP